MSVAGPAGCGRRRAALWARYAAPLLLLCVPLFCGPGSSTTTSETVWLTRPLLGPLLADPRAVDRLAAVLSTPGALAVVRRLGDAEELQLRTLYLASERLISEAGDSLEHKRRAVAGFGFNRRVQAVMERTDGLLKRGLGREAHRRLVAFVEQEWRRRLEGLGSSRRALSGALSYRVFATQYKGHTSFEVAIPDKCVKFANLGWQHCSGYPGKDYRVKIDYNGRSVTVKVLDVGPWNIDDNYWNPKSGPRPRRKFADLAQGMPESQAAYQKGYNGGKDQYGRKVTNPSAIDLTPDVAAKLGLKYLQNAWVTVTYLWEQPAGPKCVDGDGDGYGAGCSKGKDCNDKDKSVHPGAKETCDGRDNDCDGKKDEGLSRSCGTACGSGKESCSGGRWVGCTARQPAAEVCDGKDNDCDGQVDEGCPVKPDGGPGREVDTVDALGLEPSLGEPLSLPPGDGSVLLLDGSAGGDGEAGDGEAGDCPGGRYHWDCDDRGRCRAACGVGAGEGEGGSGCSCSGLSGDGTGAGGTAMLLLFGFILLWPRAEGRRGSTPG